MFWAVLNVFCCYMLGVSVLAGMLQGEWWKALNMADFLFGVAVGVTVSWVAILIWNLLFAVWSEYD